MLTFFLSPVGKLIGGIVVCALVLFGAYFLGKREQKMLDEKTRAEQSAILERERGAIDDRTKTSTDRALCVAVGGVWSDDGKCL